MVTLSPKSIGHSNSNYYNYFELKKSLINTQLKNNSLSSQLKNTQTSLEKMISEKVILSRQNAHRNDNFVQKNISEYKQVLSKLENLVKENATLKEQKEALNNRLADEHTSGLKRERDIDSALEKTKALLKNAEEKLDFCQNELEKAKIDNIDAKNVIKCVRIIKSPLKRPRSEDKPIDFCQDNLNIIIDRQNEKIKSLRAELSHAEAQKSELNLTLKKARDELFEFSTAKERLATSPLGPRIGSLTEAADVCLALAAERSALKVSLEKARVRAEVLQGENEGLGDSVGRLESALEIYQAKESAYAENADMLQREVKRSELLNGNKCALITSYEREISFLKKRSPQPHASAETAKLAALEKEVSLGRESISNLLTLNKRYFDLDRKIQNLEIAFIDRNRTINNENGYFGQNNVKNGQKDVKNGQNTVKNGKNNAKNGQNQFCRNGLSDELGLIKAELKKAQNLFVGEQRADHRTSGAVLDNRESISEESDDDDDAAYYFESDDSADDDGAATKAAAAKENGDVIVLD